MISPGDTEAEPRAASRDQTRVPGRTERYGGIEFGGTKTVCVIGTPGRILVEQRFATGSDPDRTVQECLRFFSRHDPVAALGIGSFGPCDPRPDSPGYGRVTTTPKPGWKGFDLLAALRSGMPGVPMAFDTDTNVAALGEWVHGAGRGVDSLVYLTIGTGIGAGIIADGNLIHGLMHPEAGHIRIPRPGAEQALFPGVCPYHGDCFEGIASGPALAARWGDPAESITASDPRHTALWDLEAQYLAAALHALVCIVSPQRIIVGGGVGAQPQLHQGARELLLDSLAGYIDVLELSEQIEEFLVSPGLGNLAGAVGAIELAARHAA